MTNPILNDSVNTRIAVLEVIVIDLKKDRDHHSGILDAMSENNHKMAMALERISTQIATVTKGIGAGFVLITTMVSAGWIYQQNLDAKIAGNTQVMSSQLVENTQDIITQDQRLDAGERKGLANAEKATDSSIRLDKVENNKVDKAKRYLR